MSTTANIPSPPPIPLVVQFGFVGSRRLVDSAAPSGLDPAAFAKALQPLLAARLTRLPAELGLDPQRHPVCGLSSLAIGGDMLFARACADLGWPHRVFLPQVREDFLAAIGSDGARDFTDAEAAAARARLAGPNVIQEHLVSESPDRRERFEDVNLELIRVCDLLVVLVRAGADGKPGGSLDAIEQAVASERTVLELRVSVDATGQPHLDGGTWHHRAALKGFTSHTSRERQTFFKRTALWVVGTHVVATLCAVVALKLAGSALVPAVLGLELLLLAVGFLLHEAMHGGKLVRALRWLPLAGRRLDGLAHAVQVWAMSRLASECARSTLALCDVPAPLGHLFTLPLPAALRPVLRTLNVLHLRATRALPPQPWTARRDAYLHGRIFRVRKKNDPGQVRYYLRELRVARQQHGWARAAFLTGSLGAFVATAGKLLFHPSGGWAVLLGGAAILLPVLAVAAMSLAAAHDLDARAHTFGEMLAFLRAQRRRLRRAPHRARLPPPRAGNRSPPPRRNRRLARPPHLHRHRLTDQLLVATASKPPCSPTTSSFPTPARTTRRPSTPPGTAGSPPSWTN
jgi:hypothetical protein